MAGVAVSTEGALVVVSVATLAFALVSGRIDRWPLTLPIAFTALGYALSWLASDALDDPETLRPVARTVAEATLVVILFADAARIRLDRLADGYAVPVRMLVVAMPLTVLLGTLTAHWVSPDAGWASALLVGAILTPTDAALGRGIVTSATVPDRLSRAITVESGLNDGIALPVVLVAASLAVASGADELAPDGFAGRTARQLVLGPVAGVAVGWVAARLLERARAGETISSSFQGIFFLASASLAFALAEAVGGNGFLAAFVGGAVFGNRCRRCRTTFVEEFMESEGRLLTMAAFVIFGAVLVPAGLEHASPRTLTLAVLCLTAVRMVPVFVSLTGSGLAVCEKLFLGWFGPRGLASILFALIVVEHDVPGEQEVLACVVLTVLLSILVHGITASALVRSVGGKS